MRGIGRSLRLLLSRFCSKDVVLLPFVHLYSTLLPQVLGDRLKPHRTRVTGISPLRGSLRAAPTKMAGQEYHDCLTGSLRNSLSSCFVDGWVPLATLHWPSFMRETRTGGSWRILQSRSALAGAPSGNVFQSPDVTGWTRYFSRYEESGDSLSPSHLLLRTFFELVRKKFKFLRKIFLEDFSELFSSCFVASSQGFRSLH